MLILYNHDIVIADVARFFSRKIVINNNADTKYDKISS